MNKNINFVILAIFIIFAASISYSIIVSAQAPEIAYPVKELGNCGNEGECKIFCDKSENMVPCVNFAERNGLMSKDEAKKVKAFFQASMKGPGGCNNKEECEVYCDDSDNIETCLDFAKKNNLMSDDELEEAEKVAKALKEGAQLPGGCKNKKACEAYCDNPDNIEECIAFAEKAGFIPQDELRDAKKAMQAIKSGIKPPGNCRGKKQCENYCNNPDNMEECLAFAEAAGFIPPEEAEMARKMMPLMQAGKMPGGCRGKEKCEAYCLDESHGEECANFALEAGLMKQEEFEMFKKTGGKGPGDCRGKEQCETFCNNPENQEACFNFAKEHGLIPEEEIKNMKEGMNQVRKGFEMAPPEVSECLKSNIGEDILEKVKSGEMMPSQQIGEGMRKCFEQMRPQRQDGRGGSMEPRGEFNEEFKEEEYSERIPINEEFREFKREDFKGNIPKEIEEMRAQFPEGVPSQEMIQKMMQEGNFPKKFQNGEIPQQYIPEQYRGTIEQYKQYQGQMPLEMQTQFPQGTQQMQPIIPPQDMQIQYQPQQEFQPQLVPVQEPIPPSSGILSPFANFGASILNILMGF